MLPEVEILGICSFFRDLSFEEHPRPWERARDPKIEVSGTKNNNIFNHMLGLNNSHRIEHIKMKSK